MAKNGVRAEKRRSGGLWDTIKTIVYAVLIALVIRTFLYEPFSIPSGSMYPTLLVGDYLFVSKYSYGYSRHSFPWGLAPYDGRVFEGEPERGDVVVFKVPQQGWADFIKRVVGLPGDRIQVVNGILNINGCAVRREEVGPWLLRDFVRTQDGSVVRDSEGNPLPQTHRGILYQETFPVGNADEGCSYEGGRQHEIVEVSDSIDRVDNTQVYVVPEGHYFMMGDNRDRSQDSRFLNSVGYVPADNLVGRAEFLFFSTDYSARLWELWDWWGAIRFDRIFRSVD